VLLVGRPTSLRGTVPIANDSDEDLFVSGPLVHTEMSEHGPMRASGSTVVPAGAAARFPVQVALDPHVPAGDYPAHVEIAGERYAVVLRVVDDVDLEVTPNRVYVTPSGKSVQTTIVTTNKGNVAVRLPAVASSVVDTGTLTMRLGATATTLAPGETRAFTVDVTPPAGHDPAMRYDVPLSLGPKDITVIVLPTSENTLTPPTAGRRPQL
jgi:hypothetical protein